MDLPFPIPSMLSRAERKHRRTCRRKPTLEGLEGRALLSSTRLSLITGNAPALAVPRSPMLVARAETSLNHHVHSPNHHVLAATPPKPAAGFAVHTCLRHAVAK
jgi:hypothetical protein